MWLRWGQSVDLVGAKKGSILSTAPAGGGFTGVILTSRKDGSGWLHDLERSMASYLMNLSDHLRSMASSSLSVVTVEDLTGEECRFLLLFSLAILLSGVFCVFLAFATSGVLLTASKPLSILLAFAPAGVVLKSSELLTPLSFATPITETRDGSTRVLLYSSARFFNSNFSFW